MRSKIAVFTAITGDYEEVKDRQNTTDAHFFLFTDKYVASSVWKVIPTRDIFSDSRRTARYHKAMPHLYFSEYEYHVWLDGSMEMRTSARFLIEHYMNGNDIMAFKHPDRNCLYEEAQACKSKKMGNPKEIDEQVKKYHSEKYPRNAGLAETKLVIRRNCREVRKFNRCWLQELINYSVRDQVSFNYCIWKIGINLGYIPTIEGESSTKRYEGFDYIKHDRK